MEDTMTKPLNPVDGLEQEHWYFVTSFAEQRGKDGATVLQYIRRHPEIFEGHIRSEGRPAKVKFDEVAYQELDKKYPPLGPVQFMVLPETERELAEMRTKLLATQHDLSESQKMVIRLQEEQGELRQQLTEKSSLLNDQKRMIEQKDDQLQKLEERSKERERELKTQSDQLSKYEKQEQELKDNLSKAKDDLQHKENEFSEEEQKRKAAEKHAEELQQELDKLQKLGLFQRVFNWKSHKQKQKQSASSAEEVPTEEVDS